MGRVGRLTVASANLAVGEPSYGRPEARGAPAAPQFRRKNRFPPATTLSKGSPWVRRVPIFSGTTPIDIAIKDCSRFRISDLPRVLPFPAQRHIPVYPPCLQFGQVPFVAVVREAEVVDADTDDEAYDAMDQGLMVTIPPELARVPGIT